MTPDQAMPRPPVAILLDLDGTLVDSLEDIADAMNATLREAGMPTHATETYRGFVGHGLAALVRCAMAPGGDHAALLASARARYEAHCVDRTRPYPSVPGMLAELRRRDIPLAVLSNKPHSMTQRVVRELLADTSFAVVMGDTPGTPRKPDPTGALGIARTLGVDASHCWLVGDSAVDLETAGAAQMVGIGVTWGFRPLEELRAAEPAALVDSPEALVRLVDDSRRVCSGP
jgi:phosphoglycolate phosphatase